jgi:hypothetical protein
MNILRSFNLAIVALVALFAGGVLVTSGHAAVNMSSVVGLWLLDEEGDVAVDSSGNGHDGTITGGPVSIAGVFGKARQFDGSDDFIGCGNDAALNLDVFTVMFWANMPATQGWNHMVSRGSHVASGTPGSVNWGVMVYSAEQRFLYEIFEDTSWTGLSVDISLGDWHHVVATYDATPGRMELFIDGVSVGSSEGVNVELDASRHFRIGGIATSGATPDNYFNGSIDEVAYFDEVLSLEDIQDIMNNGLADALSITAVSPGGKTATTWAEIKAQ